MRRRRDRAELDRQNAADIALARTAAAEAVAARNSLNDADPAVAVTVRAFAEELQLTFVRKAPKPQ